MVNGAKEVARVSPDKEAKLFEQFPRLYAARCLPLTERLMSFGFSCGDGWFEIIAKLSAGLEGLDSKPVAFQVKQKVGEFRFSLQDNEVDDPRVRELINEAKEACRRTCEVCGRPGVRGRFLLVDG